VAEVGTSKPRGGVQGRTISLQAAVHLGQKKKKEEEKAKEEEEEE